MKKWAASIRRKLEAEVAGFKAWPPPVEASCLKLLLELRFEVSRPLEMELELDLVWYK